MLRNVRDMVHLRWRTAQLMHAMVEGHGSQARAVRDVMRIEGIDSPDICDEFRLLLGEFGRRAPVYLRDEASRLWRLLRQLCARCGRRSRYLDNDGLCADCVLAEGET